MTSLYNVKSVVVLDAEGLRIAAKYYTDEFGSLKEQLEFEKDLFTKCYRANAEIIMLDKVIAIYRSSADTFFCVTGGVEDNELILASVLQALYESMSVLLRNVIDKRTLLENFDYLLLCIDEIVDNGAILETDPSIIANRVSLRSAENDMPISEQSISQALQTARDQIARSLLT